MPRVVVPVTNISPPKALHTTALAGVNNDLVYTAKTGGPGGNNIRVRYVVAGASTPLTVVVEGYEITVNVATSAASAATSTATDVKYAVDAKADAAALVTVANAASNDGTGVVAAFAFTNLAGGSWATTPPTQVVADSANDHYFTGNDGQVELEVVSTDAGAQTVTLKYNPLLAPGVTVADAVESIAAGVTRRLGPFSTREFNQNASADVYFDPSVSTTLQFRAYRIVRAT